MDEQGERSSVKVSDFINEIGVAREYSGDQEPTGSDRLRAASRSATRISDVLFRAREGSFASIATLASNAEAIDAGLLFLNGAEPFVAIVGPAGSGKSHLLNVMSSHLHQNGKQVDGCKSALDHLRQPTLSNKANLLILDDCHEIFRRPKQRVAMQQELEQRVMAGRPTLLAFTHEASGRMLNNFLPHRREWRVADISLPSSAERVSLVERMAKNEGLDISPRLVKIMAREIPGCATALSGALKNLKLVDSRWRDDQAILRSLCLMDCYFAGNSAWDLRRRIMKLAKSPAQAASGVHPLDLAVYVLVYVVGVAEAQVEIGLNLAEGEVYRRAGRFRRVVESQPEVSRIVDRFIETAVHEISD